MCFISGIYPLIFPQTFEYSLLKPYEVKPRLKETNCSSYYSVMIITIASDDVCYHYFINGLIYASPLLYKSCTNFSLLKECLE